MVEEDPTDNPMLAHKTNQQLARQAAHEGLNLRPLRLNLHPLRLNLHPLRLNLHPLRLNLHPFRLNLHPLRLNLHPLRLSLYLCMLIKDVPTRKTLYMLSKDVLIRKTLYMHLAVFANNQLEHLSLDLLRDKATPPWTEFATSRTKRK